MDDKKIDELIYKSAQKNHRNIPQKLHNKLLKVIENIYTQPTIIFKPLSFKEKLLYFLKKPTNSIVVSFLSLVILTTSVVGARQVSNNFFNKDTVCLDNIGIANEDCITCKNEEALKQNVPFELFQLTDDYYINVQSVLIDEINLFVVFELHSKNAITDDLRFTIRDLQITDENENLIYKANIENPDNANKGYKNIYNSTNSIKELFFMFGNENTDIQKLNFSFSDIEIFTGTTKERTYNSIPATLTSNLKFEKQNIQILLNENNYSTLKEFISTETDTNYYSIEKAIFTNTGFYLLVNSINNNVNISIKNNEEIYEPDYKIPIKRTMGNAFEILFTYNIENIENKISLLNNLDKSIYFLTEKN